MNKEMKEALNRAIAENEYMSEQFRKLKVKEKNRLRQAACRNMQWHYDNNARKLAQLTDESGAFEVYMKTFISRGTERP